MSSTLIGQKAPEFTLPKSDGENFSLSELDGQWKVIFFYARDGSPTCKRGCLSFKEQHDLFQSLTPPVQIIGISQDSAKDHDEFKKSKLKLEDLRKKIKEKKIIYGHSVDQSRYKWGSEIILRTAELSNMPDYLRENYKKYVNWLEI